MYWVITFRHQQVNNNWVLKANADLCGAGLTVSQLMEEDTETKYVEAGKLNNG